MNGRKVIALEARLRDCRNVTTLGARPNFSDYTQSEKDQIRRAEKVYYPTAFYADLLDAAGKKTFPSYHTYKCVQDKIKQTALFQLRDIPHPQTRTFYGSRQKEKIPKFFNFPFVAKVPRGSAMGRGVFFIENQADLEKYCHLQSVAYIQEYMPVDRDIRAIVIGKRVVHAYWRKVPKGDFRSNIAAGGVISLDPVPQAALDLALKTAMACGWDDVGMDICRYNDRYYVIEANMKYGKEGFRQAKIDYTNLMENLIQNGEI